MKTILNTTQYDMGDKQIRQMIKILGEECQVIRTSEPLEYDGDEEVHINPSLASDFSAILADEINNASSKPDIIILDVPRKLVPYIEALYKDTDIQRYYILPALSKVIELEPLKMSYV